jgi:hypothetical protein
MEREQLLKENTQLCMLTCGEYDVNVIPILEGKQLVLSKPSIGNVKLFYRPMSNKGSWIGGGPRDDWFDIPFIDEFVKKTFG